MALFSTIGGIIQGNKQSKAIDKATDVSLQATQENNALSRENRDLFFDRSDPFVNGGSQAFGVRNALLGLGGTPQAAGSNVTNYYSGANPGAAPNAGTVAGQNGQSAQQAANDAFQMFRDSTGYQFRRDEGMNALNSGFAGSGLLQSGAAMNAAQEYGQDYASNEFNNYFNQVGSQQSAGLNALGAQAGVGSNYTAQVTANNNTGASTQANAALAGANSPLANAFSSIGGSVRGGASALLGGF